MKLPRGMKVPRLREIHECYEMIDGGKHLSFMANVGEEKMEALLRRFCEEMEEPGFFMLETPTCQKDEAPLHKSDRDPLHRDIHYLPNLNRAGMLDILNRFGELLIQDGLATFGFASHENKDEIFVGKYKVFNIFAFTRDEQKYRRMLEDFGIPAEEEIKTAWNTFTRQSPGECYRVEVDGLDVFKLVKALEPEGLFFVRRIEER